MSVFATNFAITMLGMTAASFIGIIIAIFPLSISTRIAMLVMACFFTILAWGYRKNASDSAQRRLGITGVITVSLYFLWPHYAFINLAGLAKINPYTVSAACGIFIFTLYVAHYKSLLPDLLKNIKTIQSFIILFILWTLWRIACNFLTNETTQRNTELVRELIFTYSALIFSLFICLRPNGIRTLSRVLLACTVLVGLAGILESLEAKNRFVALAATNEVGDLAGVISTITSEKLRGGSYRVQSVFGHPILFGQFLGAMLPLTIATFFFEKSKAWRLLAIVAIPIIAIGIYKSGSRSGTMAAAISILTLTCLILSHTIVQRSRYRLLAIASIPLIAIAIISWHGFFNEIILGTSHSESTSSSARLTQIQLALNAINDSPLYGFGLGSALNIAGVTTSLNTLTMDIFYLSLILDSGWVGFVLFLLMATNLFLVAIKLTSSSHSEFYFYAAAYTAAAAAALTTLTAISIPQNIVFVFFAASVVAAVGANEQHK